MLHRPIQQPKHSLEPQKAVRRHCLVLGQAGNEQRTLAGQTDCDRRESCGGSFRGGKRLQADTRAIGVVAGGPDCAGLESKKVSDDQIATF